MHHKTLRYGRFLAIAGALGGLAALGFAPSATSAAPVAASFDTEDVLYLEDGRVLRGRIVSEERLTIRFEVIDRTLNQRTTITVFKDKILKMERGVEVAVETLEPAGAETGGAEATESTSKPAEPIDPSVPSIYVIPMKGKMGTDIRPEIYPEIIEDVKKHDPTLVVYEFESNAMEEIDYWNEGLVPEYYDFEDYRVILTQFKQGLRNYPQVMWVRNSIGVGCVLSLGWETIYMSEDARLGGLVFVDALTAGWQDQDVRAKMQAAWSGIVKGFMEHGKHDLNLGHALMFNEAQLSASFRGRKVEWSLDTTGEVIVDNSDRTTPIFTAADARDFRIAQEVVEGSDEDQLRDLAFLLGYREFRECDGIGRTAVENYITNWRAALERTEKLWRDHQDYQGFATGDQAVAYMGKSIEALRQILAAMNRYKAVEKTWESRGVTKLMIERMIEEYQRNITTIRQQERERGRSRGGGGGGNGPGLPGGGG